MYLQSKITWCWWEFSIFKYEATAKFVVGDVRANSDLMEKCK